MRVIRDWRGLSARDRGAAVALGNFDGVHRGHQKVIAQAAEAARRLGAPLGVISFEPHPRRIFQPNEPAFRLMRPAQQARALEALGVDLFYILPFDEEMKNLTDREFAREVLHEGLGVRHVAVGFDISFGKGRTGSPATMSAYGEEFGFSVSVAAAVADKEGEKYSSTGVRDALRDGRPEVAAAILGRPFAIEGPVQRGRQLGRELGFPTANVQVDDYVQPKFGVYATRTRLPDGREVPGVANIGVNPTVGEVAPVLEVWLFDFDEDIYDQTIETDLITFLRPELKFDGLDAMVEQVMRDAAQARKILMPEF
ncbi:bifunctional riboflavin kinase/FAD synthetase [Phenylobacterium sp.]|uniref:bifunctional riboflavin kinase/FAD synthetase n=1 Tax=Phenylobacterium sp. TaxID=1871053 RepID=UPI0008C4C642|nr:bifunctional riboflavin kinase/FAD synthetase [Phenylobacterium sp.]MBA4793142.1 bifunctional riboflavin kinase/FAD synthetase [Phenylobacterium sp.]MBC7166295.1 bifunctional riboflavin kinase/FAD synthetase [Phenylobacterium sp.]OHB33346.1 MAG: riboflavin biosynthesis protein RibF [Phenylobacterium sp. RIFCSPHIGHO2_01_FULL_70_10]